MLSKYRFVVAAILVALFCVGGVLAQEIKAISAPKLAHILSISESHPDSSLKIEPVTGFDRSSLVRNPSKTREAYILGIPVPDGSKSRDSRVFVKDIRAKVTYVIIGEPGGVERYRPVDSLKWLTDDTLSYERWTGPHFGYRYVFNVKTKKQTAAYTLTG